MPPEPFSVFAGKKATDIAVRKIDQILKDAENTNKWRVERCEKFLEACSEAIRGLEREYDEILVQAGSFEGSPEEVKYLKDRINEYLNVDKLRDRLGDAIEGLEFYQDAFDQKAKSILNWPWKRKDKKEAAKQFAKTLRELNAYLKKLSGEDLPFRKAGTGIGIEAILSIKSKLDVNLGNQTAAIKELSEKYLSEREKEKEPMFQKILILERL